MRKRLFHQCLVAVAIASAAACFPMRQTFADERLPQIVPLSGACKGLIDAQWRFHLGDAPDAEKTAFDDSAWRQVRVPHDWSIEGPAGKEPKTMEGPFDRKSPAGACGGFLNGGVGWYRKTFTLPNVDSNTRVFIQFDGVYMDSDVWLNGRHLGRHPYGYTGFQYDATEAFNRNGKNTLAVRANVEQPCSRWYSGAGIYRNVRIRLASPVHIAENGIYVTTPEVSDREAEVRVRTTVRNDGPTRANVTLKTQIAKDANHAAQTQTESTHGIASGETFTFDQTLKIANPERWSIENPRLYVATASVLTDGNLSDDLAATFGVRTIRFTADRGFLLNGQHVPIYGVCNHHDLGCLGAAVNRSAIERQLQILKTMGCNAIRTVHNPPDPQLLDLCDRMGFMVKDEAFDEWKINKTKFGYARFFDAWSESDLVSMIRRDRNHPCVILWSIGNEILEQRSDNGGPMARRLADICHREDPTRPVTAACNFPNDAVKHGLADALDVFGINYSVASYKLFRGRPMFGSETSSTLSSRGEYFFSPDKDGKLQPTLRDHQQCTSYDLDKPTWCGTAEDGLLARKHSPWVAGEFAWSGFDYIGEPTPFWKWPSRSSYFGMSDLCGFPKDRYYLYQSQWSDRPMAHILPHWNWEGRGFEGREIPVWCYSNADSVELFLNGKSCGKQTRKEMKKLHFEWRVPYTPGVLKAVAKKAGNVVATDEVYTAGKPAKLVLAADRKDIAVSRDELAFVQVRAVDAAGHLCPNADNLVRFTIRGPGEIVGLGNGDPTNHEPFQGDRHRVFHGLGLVVIRGLPAAGEVELEAAADSLQSAAATIGVQP